MNLLEYMRLRAKNQKEYIHVQTAILMISSFHL